MVSLTASLTLTREAHRQLFLLFGQLLEQMFPIFINARAIYEVRERPSKIYSWRVGDLPSVQQSDSY